MHNNVIPNVFNEVRFATFSNQSPTSIAGKIDTSNFLLGKSSITVVTAAELVFRDLSMSRRQVRPIIRPLKQLRIAPLSIPQFPNGIRCRSDKIRRQFSFVQLYLVKRDKEY
ncbi:hypothetical protein AVEN_237537-1 [Araneus ventricosus]|uniref:Uncharacterized protein n=1 Tax=Araneus ventricosus TaxID=182803 RepID=A0A4Y2NHJ8_ARAVE|nr:hypothetical protein AVEN_237537-1 [Araneus ventricosus]